MAREDAFIQLDRRAALKLGGALGIAGALGSLSQRVAAGALPPRPLRNAGTERATRMVGPPPLPPLSEIVLNRLAFGPAPGERAAFQTLGGNDAARLQAWVDQQLNPGVIDDSLCDARLAAAGFVTLNKSLAQLWADHVVNNDQGWSYRMLPVVETEHAAWIRAVYSKRQLFEVLADFWHNHFNVYGWDSYTGPTFVHYDRDVIRANILGNFRQMLEAVARSTAMLYYLDNYLNQAGGFNENFGRELLELHTLGAENYLGVADPFSVPTDANGMPLGYVDNDVYEAARCFTGWRVDYSSWEPGVGQSGLFLYYDAWHDRANKFFLQQYFPADQPPMKDGLDVLDLLARHPGTARHIARKLCRRLVSDEPPQDVVDAAAAVFQAQVDAPDQLKQVVRAICLHPAFSSTWGDKVKRPFEAIAGFMRATAADFTPSNEFGWNFEEIGQPLFSHHPPDGYADVHAAWTGTTAMLQRWKLGNRLMEGWVDGTSIDPLSQMPAGVRSPNAIADFWINRILGRPMHPVENRQELVEFLAQGRNPDFDLPAEEFAGRTPRMVALLLMSPDFLLR